MIIPNMWKNKKCFKPPTSIHLTLYAPFVHMTHVSTGQTNGISIDLLLGTPPDSKNDLQMPRLKHRLLLAVAGSVTGASSVSTYPVDWR